MMFSAIWAMVFGQADLGSQIDNIARKAKLPGVGVALMSGEGLEWSHYYGVKKVGDEVPVDAKTRWHLGSDTKTMTALAVSRVAEMGALKLDAPLSKVFSDFKIHPGFKDVTLRHLLSHKAGLPANLDWWELKDRDAVIRAALEVPPTGEVGKFEYSNTGYVLAGAAAEIVTGKSIEKMIAEEMVALEISTLGFGPTGKNEAWPHQKGKAMADWNLDNAAIMTAAGRAHMSLPDWGKFISALLKGFEGKKTGLPTNYFSEIKTNPLGGTYSMGWLLLDRPWAGGLALTHAGSNTMNYCVAWVAPEKDRAILVVTNMGGDEAEKAADEIVGAVIKAKF